MRILFVSHNPLTQELGAPKVLIELAEEMAKLGCTCRMLQPSDLGMASIHGFSDQARFSLLLRHYLSLHAGGFDVVDYDHEYLPFPRAEFDSQVLMVARSVLLVHHLRTIGTPQARGLRAAAGRLFRGRRRKWERDERITRATRTIQEADVANVSNHDDKAELVRRGLPSGKIVVLPFGMGPQRRRRFDEVSVEVPRQPLVVFVGTFDYRKGASDFPTIVREILADVPNARFRLLGTAGLNRTAEQVLGFFPAGTRSAMEIRPTFVAEELPDLLADASVGVFPSYFEGFGFGVLEMLAAAVPVIAYDAPGPPMMLPPEWLVPPGDARGMAAKVAMLLRDRRELALSRPRARDRSRPFDWARIAGDTIAVYQTRLNRLRSARRS